MSYPSIVSVLANQGIVPEVASDLELGNALFGAFEQDLALGTTHLRELADRVTNGEERILDIQDPNSPLGKQLIRLVGTDVAREICEGKFGVAFGMYNCCSIVVAPTRARLNMSRREQVMLQNGKLAHADC